MAKDHSKAHWPLRTTFSKCQNGPFLAKQGDISGEQLSKARKLWHSSNCKRQCTRGGQEQVTKEESKNTSQACRDSVREAKIQLKLKSERNVKGNSSFCIKG